MKPLSCMQLHLRVVILSIIFAFSGSAPAYAQGEYFHKVINKELPVVELQLNTNGDVVKRANATLRVQTGSWNNGPFYGTLFVSGEKYGVLMECSKNRDVTISRYNTPGHDFEKMLSAYSPKLSNREVQIVRFTQYVDDDHKCYLTYETYDTATHTSKTHDVVYEIDKEPFIALMTYYMILGDSFGYSNLNTIAGGVPLK